MKKIRTKKEPFVLPQDAAKRIADGIEQIKVSDAGLQDWFEGYAASQMERIAFDYEMIKECCPRDSKIVEVASIPLLLTLPLKKAGFDVTGVDLGPERFEATIRKYDLEIRKCDIEKEPLPFGDNECDVVIFNEIFEHLRINLIFTMRQVLRILRPGGRLLLSTRNLRSLVGIRNFLFRKIAESGSTNLYNEYSKLETIGHMGHVREYTSTEVAGFLTRIGFTVETIVYRGQYESRLDNLIIKACPRLRPYYTCIARKPIPGIYENADKQ